MPARFAIGQDGTILYAEVNPDYTSARNLRTCCLCCAEPARSLPDPFNCQPLRALSGDW